MITLKGISAPARQIAITNIGRDQPTLLITNGHATPAKDLFARYAERMLIENEPDAYISGSASTRCPPACRSTSTWTPRSPSSPATSTGSSPAACRATPAPPPTPSGGTSSTTPEPCTSPRWRHPRPDPAQPPPRPHRRRLRRPPGPHPMVGRPHPPLPFPAALTGRPGRTGPQLNY